MPCTEKTVTYMWALLTSGNIPPRAEIESANDTYSSDNWQHLKTWPMIVRPRFCKLPPEKVIMTLGPSFF